MTHVGKILVEIDMCDHVCSVGHHGRGLDLYRVVLSRITSTLVISVPIAATVSQVCSSSNIYAHEVCIVKEEKYYHISMVTQSAKSAWVAATW